MLRMVIVDDEPIIADGLYEEFLGIADLELDVYRVYSGKAVVDMLQRTRIDIVVSDIRMPGLDGMALLDIIHDNWPECKVIFLTGFKEFDHAYRAIRSGAVNFVLKTEGYDKVVEAVRQAVAAIEASLKVKDLLDSHRQDRETMSLLLRKDFLLSLLRGNCVLGIEPRKELDQLGISLLADRPLLLFMGKMDRSPGALTYIEKSKCFYSVSLIAEQQLSAKLSCFQVVDDRDNMVWFAQPHSAISTDEDDASAEELKCRASALFLKGTLETIQRICKDSLGTTVSFAVWTEPTPWRQIADRHAELRHLMDYRIGSGTERLVTNENLAASESVPAQSDARRFAGFASSKLHVLESHLEKGERELFFARLAELTKDLTQDLGCRYAPAQELYFSIAMILFSSINRWKLVDHDLLKAGYRKLLKPEEHENWTAGALFLKQTATQLFELRSNEEQQRATDTITFLQGYIDDHIFEDLSLVRLSELVFFNPAYLSRLFKQVTGINLSDYIQERKIHKAKQLLERNECKINDIAEALGYGYGANFARSFKKMTNQSPKEYRESLNK